jgi:hypothetical protein
VGRTNPGGNSRDRRKANREASRKPNTVEPTGLSQVSPTPSSDPRLPWGMPTSTLVVTVLFFAAALALGLTEMNPIVRFWIASLAWIGVIGFSYLTVIHSHWKIKQGAKHTIGLVAAALICFISVLLLKGQWKNAYPPTGPCVNPLSFEESDLRSDGPEPLLKYTRTVSLRPNNHVQLWLHSNNQIINAEILEPSNLAVEMGVSGPPMKVVGFTLKQNPPPKIKAKIKSPYPFSIVCLEYVSNQKQPPETITKPLELSRETRLPFISALRTYPAVKQGHVAVYCADGSEASCAKATEYLIALSEAGWNLREPRINRIRVDNPQSGVTISSHVGHPRNQLPIHLGTWEPMNTNAQALLLAFGLMGILPKTAGDISIPEELTEIYFGPETSP